MPRFRYNGRDWDVVDGVAVAITPATAEESEQLTQDRVDRELVRLHRRKIAAGASLQEAVAAYNEAVTAETNLLDLRSRLTGDPQPAMLRTQVTPQEPVVVPQEFVPKAIPVPVPPTPEVKIAKPIKKSKTRLYLYAVLVAAGLSAAGYAIYQLL